MSFRFAHPVAFLLLLIPLSFAVTYYTGRWLPVATAMRYSDLRLLNGLAIGWRARFHRLPDVLRMLAWLLLIIALARPQGGRTQQIIRGRGIDIVLVLDISGSMAALDFAPQNRLDAAKSVISDFIVGRDFDRIGLVAFARDAFQQTPPTLDYSTLVKSLNALELATVLEVDDGTAIGLGIASAGNMLRASDTVSKIIVLLTDGANNSGGIGPITAAQAVATFGIRVYTIGMGKTGLVPVPVDDVGNTQMVESDLDEPTLQIIAQSTNGKYFRAQDLPDLQAIYDEINRLERSDIERQTFINWQEQSEGFLWGSIILLVLERLLRHTIFQIIP
jgi:Ca-activated chloride channel homolog